MLMSIQWLSPKTIHVFGDSHASFCFRSISTLAVLPVSIGSKNLVLPLEIYWLGPITMHRVGRDGLSFLDLRNYFIQEKDVVVFVFGEIDVRCHIGKQRDTKNRDLAEIIETLATNYINTILQNQKLFSSLTCIVCSVTPPIDGYGRNNPEYPFYGQLSDRVAITCELNKKIQQLCQKHNLLFLDFYDLYTDHQGALNLKFADPTVHIDSIFNVPIKKRLVELIAGDLIAD